MILLEWIAKEIKKRIPLYERLGPMAKGWRSKTIGQRGDGTYYCWINATNLGTEKPYFIIAFRNDQSGKRIRIHILPWEEEQKTPRKILKPMRKVVVKKRQKKESPFIFNPLYVSDQLPIEDIETLIALRLLQEGEPFYDVVERWIRKSFRVARKIDDLSELVEYLRDHFNLQEHWLGLRGYLRKAINKFVSKSNGREIQLFPFVDDEGKERDRMEEISEEDYKESYGIESTGGQINEIEEIRREETRRGAKSIPIRVSGSWGTWEDKNTGKTWYTVERASELTGIPDVTLYRWIRDRKIKARRERATTGREFLFVVMEEVQKIMEQKKMRRKVAERIAEKMNIDSNSARRWIKRQEISGLSLNEIIKKAKKISTSTRDC